MSYRDSQNPGIDLTGTLTLGEVTFVQALYNGVSVDPNADRILFWDDSAGAYAFLSLGSGLAITGTTLDTTAGSGANAALSNLASVAINTDLLLGTSDGGALGSATKMWSDLFLASGAVINFNASDVTLTHSADTLTLGGGNLALGANNLTMTGSLAATGARVTKGWFTDVESTNMFTVGGTSLSSTFAAIAQTFFLGTTSIAINRATASIALTGITSIDGSAATLTTTRTIWGQNFNGSANVTGTLALGASDLTLTGSIGATGARATKVWTAALESTAMPTVGGTAILTSLTAPQFTTIELGAATDTTISRVSAGVIAVEGVNVLLTGGALGTPSSGTLTNATGLPAAAVLAGTLGTGAYVMDTKLTVPQVINTANAITATANAATVPVTSRHNIVTNNSAATLTITLTTTSAVNMQMVIVQILDFSAATQTITWVNTENSTVSAPTTSNGSTTLPLTVGFIYNTATSKWRCIASA